MRQMHGNFIRSNQMRYASDMARTQSTIVKSTPPVEPQPEEPVVEPQPEPVVEVQPEPIAEPVIEPVVEPQPEPVVEEKPIEEQPKTTSRLPNFRR